jgi:hypothetical protein
MAVMEGLAQCTVEVATEARQVVARAVVQEAATVSAREVVSAAGRVVATEAGAVEERSRSEC